MSNLSCAYHDPVDKTRFLLVFCFSSTIATIGVFFNLALLYYFGGTRNRESPTLYLRVLAFLDASICGSYVLLFGADAAIHYFKIETWYRLWTLYGIPIFTYSRVVQLASIYIIIAGTIERFIIVFMRTFRLRPATFDSVMPMLIKTKSRYVIITAIIIGSIILRIITVFEMKIEHYDECNSTMADASIVVTDLVHSKAHQIFNSYVFPVIQVVIPFVGLFVLNLAIIVAERGQYRWREYRRRSYHHRLLHQLSQQNLQINRTSQNVPDVVPVSTRTEIKSCPHLNIQPGDGEMTPLSIGFSTCGVYFRQTADRRERERDQEGVKKATYTFVAIIVTYLVCNSLHLFVLILETLPNQPWLFEYEPFRAPSQFYVLTTDLISFLFMFNSFVRVFIYLTFNTQMRIELLKRPVWLASHVEEEEHQLNPEELRDAARLRLICISAQQRTETSLLSSPMMKRFNFS